MPLRTWIHADGENLNGIRHSLITTLQTFDITVADVGPEQPRGAGLLLFDEATPELYETLHLFSRAGHERVLALASCRARLADDAVWRLLGAGASDVLALEEALDVPGEIAARLARWHYVDNILERPLIRDNLVGQSPAWLAALRQIIEVAHFTVAPVLIFGESGTGKELAARLIHTLDERPDKGALVVLDCTTIVPELSGSEFFGHEKGAYTSAGTSRDGAFALAHKGTLFLDEIGELPLNLQAQLLRVVQERTYKRVGGNQWHNTEFRLVCATHRDLWQQVRRGEFRHDLYHRIASSVCTLPPLRERSEDILPLARHFMLELRPGDAPPELDEAVREYLLKRDYPGNVRDLKQAVSRLLYRHAGQRRLSIGSIPPDERPTGGDGWGDWRDAAFDRSIRRALQLGIGLKAIARTAEDVAIRLAVDDESGNLQRAARRLGITDRALQLRRAAQRQTEARPEP